MHQAGQLLALGCIEGQGGLTSLAGELGLQTLDIAQLGFPLSLETAGDEAVFRVDLLVAALSKLGSIASAFQPEFPLLAEFRLLAFHFLDNGQAEFDLGRSQSSQHGLSNDVVHSSTGYPLADGFGVASLAMATDVGNVLAIFAAVDYLHTLSATATQYDPRQESRTISTTAGAAG